MKINGAQVIPYALPLRRPLPGAGATERIRRGLLLRVHGNGDSTGWGEAAPLPGFSRESLDDTTSALHAFAASILQAGELPTGTVPLLAASGALTRDAPPSARFACETALLALAQAQTGVAWHAELVENALPVIPVSALLDDEGDDVVTSACAALEAGHTGAKLKVGRRPVAEDAACCRRIVQATDGRLRLRLDANRTWTFDAAVAFADAVSGLPVDYVEEPLHDVSLLPAFVRTTGVRLALDETLRDNEAPPAAKDVAAVWVIKPTLTGGVAATLALARAARRGGRAVVISSAFESSSGLRSLAQLAAAVQDAGTHAGLGTADWFARDTLGGALVSGGGIDVADALHMPVIAEEGSP
jgi:O-succinylbenzoate synthase